MYKTLSVAVLLLATLVLTSASKFNDSNGAQAAPPVLRVNLTDQTAPIPQTTLFTPSETGFYRISVYMVITTPGSGGGYWWLDLYWTDDAGSEDDTRCLLVQDSMSPPFAYVMGTFNIMATAGQPVTYDIQTGGPRANGTYELHMVIERL